jgi:hypothetical protein
MDYDDSETIFQQDLMPYRHEHDTIRLNMSADITDLSYDSRTGGISKASAALWMSLKSSSDHRDRPSNKFDAFLEASQSSISSAYSVDDPPTDATSLNDQSSSTFSDEEGSAHHWKHSQRKIGIRQPKCITRTSEDGYSKSFDSDEEFLYEYTAYPSADSLSLQQGRNCINPHLLYSQESVNSKIDGSQSQGTHSRKRRRQLERSQITQPHDCSTTIDSGTTIRVPLLSSQALSEAHSACSPLSFRNLKGVYAEISSPSDHQDMNSTIDVLAALLDASVRELLKRTVDYKTNGWSPPSPAACLAKIGGKAVAAKPRNPKKPYACVCGCGYTSARMIDWKRHMTSNWLASYWKCPLCPKHFPPDRADKLYGKEGHLAKVHSLVEAEANKERDYHHNVIDDMFEKHCGFCGQICNSFGKFARHVGAHFRDNHASPPYDLRIWKDSWEDEEIVSSAKSDVSSNKKDGSDHHRKIDHSESPGCSFCASGGDGPAEHKHDYVDGSQQDQTHLNQFIDYPAIGCDFVAPRPDSLGPTSCIGLYESDDQNILPDNFNPGDRNDSHQSSQIGSAAIGGDAEGQFDRTTYCTNGIDSTSVPRAPFCFLVLTPEPNQSIPVDCVYSGHTPSDTRYIGG